MGPIDPPPPPGTYETYFILFLDLSEHEKWMPPLPNWDGLPVGRHFPNGHQQNLWNYIFANNSVSRIDRDKILVYKPMFMRNPMSTLKNSPWLLVNSKLKWLPSKPAEITLISQWAQYCHEHTKPMLFCHWDLSQHEKSMPPPLNWDGLPI